MSVTSQFFTLNVDLKLFTRILASCLAPEIPAVVHYDQVGFIITREARDSVPRIIDLMHVYAFCPDNTPINRCGKSI